MKHEYVVTNYRVTIMKTICFPCQYTIFDRVCVFVSLCVCVCVCVCVWPSYDFISILVLACEIFDFALVYYNHVCMLISVDFDFID